MQHENARRYNAIELNNIGVQLLERACYDQARLTLRDAVNMLRSSFLNERERSMSESSGSKRCLKDAIKRLSQPQRTQIRSARAPVTYVRNLADNYRSILHESVIDYGRLYVLRIDDISCDPSFPSVLDNPHLQAAAILFNFATCHLCLARCSVCPEDVKNHYGCSSNLLEFAMTLMRELPPDEAFVKRGNCFILAVYETYIELLTDLHQTDQLRVLRQRVAEIRSSANIIYDVYDAALGSLSTAGAA